MAPLYDFFRNNNLNANDFFSNRAGNKLAAFNSNQFGFSVGGPVFHSQGVRRAQSHLLLCRLSRYAVANSRATFSEPFRSTPGGAVTFRI